MQGIFFSIATIALTIVIETSVTNWRFVGGAAGIQMQRPPVMPPFNSYVQMLFFVQALLVVLAVAIARYIQGSWIGRGLQALKDDELAAECTGVPTLRLKLLACVISGALMCAAGAPAAMYLQYADPSSAFNLNYSVSVLAMSLIGGTAHWAGPVIGAILLGVTQQLLAVTISSEVNVLVLGIMLVLFVVVAPEGLIGLIRKGVPQARGGQGMMSAERTRTALAADRRITKRFGGFTALDNVSVDIRPGERFGLIGPNGSGKTTLINCISGAFRTEAGTVVFRGEDITRLPPYLRTRRGIARSFQIPRPFKSMTVAENLMVALDFATAADDLVSAAQRRDSVMSILDADGPRGQGRRVGHKAQPGRIAQDGARPRGGGASEAPDFRRGHGRPFQLGSR